MAYKPLVSLETDYNIALGGFNKAENKDNPTEIEGYYLGSSERESPKSKTGVVKVHVFRTEDATIGVWGRTNLDRQLANAAVGQMTLVTFTGMRETKNNPMYVFSVQQDDTKTLDVASLTQASAAASESYSEESEEESLDEATPARPSAPRAPAAPPSSDQKARAQALLSRGRTSKIG